MAKTKHGGSRRLRQKAEKHAQANAQGAEDADAQDVPEDGPAPAGHLQRKVNKRMRFLEKVAASKASSLAARPSIHKRSRRNNERIPASLTDYSELLGTLEGAAKKTEAAAAGKAAKLRQGLGRGGSKKRSKITLDETVRLQQVLSHPSFQADPLAAVRAHLDSTLPAAPQSQQPKGPKKKKADTAMQEG